jgi:hypothetical protein
MKEHGFELDEEGCLIDNEDEEDYWFQITDW